MILVVFVAETPLFLLGLVREPLRPLLGNIIGVIVFDISLIFGVFDAVNAVDFVDLVIPLRDVAVSGD